MQSFGTLRQSLLGFWITVPPRRRKEKKIPLTPMGVLAPGSAHARPSAQPPIDVSGNFRHLCLQTHLQRSHFSEEVMLKKLLWRSYAKEVTLKKLPWRSYAEEVTLKKLRWRSYTEEVKLKKWRWKSDTEEVALKKLRWRSDAEEVTLKKWRQRS